MNFNFSVIGFVERMMNFVSILMKIWGFSFKWFVIVVVLFFSIWCSWCILGVLFLLVDLSKFFKEVVDLVIYEIVLVR